MAKSDLATQPLNDDLGELLRAELLEWRGVVVRPMMGCIAFSRGREMLGCYVNRDISTKKPWWMNSADEPPLAWVRLRKIDAARALGRTGVRSCRTGAASWIEIPLASRTMLEEALLWFGVAYQHPVRKQQKRRKHR